MKSGGHKRSVIEGVVRQCKRDGKTMLTRLLFVCLALTVVSGCGRYKQELEDVKAQVDKLTAENKKCVEISAGLEKEKQKMSEDRQAVDAKTDILVKQLSELKRTNKALSDELGTVRKRESELSQELKKLRKEKSDLAERLEEMKSSGAGAERPGQPFTAGRTEGSPMAGTDIAKAPENMTPCDACIAFMKATEQTVRRYGGAQRAEMLKKVKQEYQPRMKGAPEKAVKNADAWVDELSSTWDNPGDDMVFSLITKRNAVLDACEKNPTKSGF